MKKLILAICFTATTLTGCSSQQTAKEQENKQKTEKPEKITVKNINLLSFKEVDINEDGKFTYDEFDKITENNGDADGNTVYADYDVDGNGIISEKEFKAKQ